MQQIQANLIEAWILAVFNHGISVCGAIMGRRGTGKTDIGLLIAEILFRFNRLNCIATNCKIYETPPGLSIEHINDMETLENWAIVNPGRKLFVLDEAGKAIRRRTPMAKLNIEVLDKLQTLRKYKLSLLMITPAEKYIDSASLGSDVLDFIVLKPKFNDPKIGDFYDTMTGERESFRDIPGTSIKFDTWDSAPFTLKPKNPKINFPSKAVEMAYKNAKEGTTARELGLDPKQLNRYYKYSIIYFVENSLTPGNTKS